MCIICIDFERGSLKLGEARRALREMSVKLDPAHAREVQEKLDRAEAEAEQEDPPPPSAVSHNS